MEAPPFSQTVAELWCLQVSKQTEKLGLRGWGNMMSFDFVTLP